jgi:hypothetical protein
LFENHSAPAHRAGAPQISGRAMKNEIRRNPPKSAACCTRAAAQGLPP